MKANQERDAEMRRKGYLKPTEAAELVHVHEMTVRAWARTGKVESVMLGPQRYVKRASLLAHVGKAQCRLLGIV